MNGDVEYLFNERNRLIFLLRSAEEQEREKHLDALQKTTDELKRLWADRGD